MGNSSLGNALLPVIVAIVTVVVSIVFASVVVYLGPKGSPVVVTTRDVPAGAMFTGDNVLTTSVLSPPADAITTMRGLIGELTTVNLPANAVITAREPLTFPRNMDEITLPISGTTFTPGAPLELELPPQGAVDVTVVDTEDGKLDVEAKKSDINTILAAIKNNRINRYDLVGLPLQ